MRWWTSSSAPIGMHGWGHGTAGGPDGRPARHGQDTLARAVAGEADVLSSRLPARALSSCSLVSAPRRYGICSRSPEAGSCHHLRRRDRRHRPATGGKRFVANDEREQTLNQLLPRWTDSTPRPGSSSWPPPTALSSRSGAPAAWPVDRRSHPAPDARGAPGNPAGSRPGQAVRPDGRPRSGGERNTGILGRRLANLINEAAIVAVRADREVMSGRTLTKPGTASFSADVKAPTS